MTTITLVVVCKKEVPKGQISYTVQTRLTDEHTVKLEKVITRPKKLSNGIIIRERGQMSKPSLNPFGASVSGE